MKTIEQISEILSSGRLADALNLDLELKNNGFTWDELSVKRGRP
jgi:hypothetical protein